MLTESQVAKARTFPGCGDITAETAVDKLFAAAETLQTAAAQAAGGADKHALAMSSSRPRRRCPRRCPCPCCARWPMRLART
jgi:hypothetical protein